VARLQPSGAPDRILEIEKLISARTPWLVEEGRWASN